MDDDPQAAPPRAWIPVATSEPRASPVLVRSLAMFSRVAAALVALTGAAVLVGWAADVRWLKDPVGGFLPMVPNTALMLVASGISLWLVAPAPAPRRRVAVARAFALGSGAIALASLTEHVLDRDLGVDRLLLDLYPAAPALATAIALVLSNAALLLLDAQPRRIPRVAEVFAVGAAVLGAVGLGGVLYGALPLWTHGDVPHVRGMAVHTSAALIVLAAGLLSARSEIGAMAIVTSPLVGGQVVRRMLPVVLCIFVLGYLAVLAQRAGFYSPPGAAVVTAVGSMLVASLIALGVGHSLNGADARRRRTEAEIREWKRFFDRATFGAVFGTPDSRLGRINEAFARMHGYTVAELEGAPVVDVFPPDRRAELVEKIRVANELGHCRWESEHVRKDGTTFPVVVDLTAVRDEHGKLLYRAAYIQDITEEKEAEAVRARLASLVQSAEDAIVAKALDGTVLDWNRGAERLFGYTAEEAVGRSVMIVVPEDRRAEWLAMRDRALGGETVMGFETVRVRKDGQHVPVSLTLSPIYGPVERVVGISTIERDIRREKQIEAELRRARERELAHRVWLETVIEHTPEGIVIVGERGELLLQNAAAAALACGAGPFERGPEPPEIRAPSGETLAAEDVPAQRALLHGETISARELVVVAATGELIPVLVSAAPIQVDGVRRGAVAILRDIRAMKQLEREREEWASVVAHDLRQPASAIRLATEILARADAPAKESAVERLRRASDRLERMIEDLLAVSCIESRRLDVRQERVSLTALLAEVLDLAPNVSSRCRTKIEPDADRAWADGGRVVQVLSNLLSNADKYGDPGTPIDLRAERSGEMVRISVTNEGPGIPPDEIEGLFSRFARTRTARAGRVPGLGLGLYISRRIIEAMGGKLWVESVPGDKTHFRFTLPLASATAEKLSA